MRKIYAIYDMKDHEQCVFLGNMDEIAKFLNYSRDSLYSHMSRQRKGKRKLLNHRYELVKIVEEV